MKTINLSIAGIAVLSIMFSCSSDKQVQLSKLKQEQINLGDKIRTLETEVRSSKAGELNPEEFKFVGVSDVKTEVFDHFIRVQGKVDGDQNAGVFAEAPGTITQKFSDVGQTVVKGQVLAQIDDQQYRSQLEGLETQYKFATEMFDKQKNLWDQKIGSEVQFLQSKTTKESLERQISSLKQQIDKFKIKSPIDGTIEECNIKGWRSCPPPIPVWQHTELLHLKI